MSDRRRTSDDLKKHRERTVSYSDDIYSYSSRRRKNEHNKKRIAINVILSVVLCISILLTSFSVLANSDFLRKSIIDRNEDKSDGFEEIVKSDNEDLAYFLIAGVDLSESLTDIIMVACYDLNYNKVSIMQIPRDTYVGSDVRTGKINAVYGSAREGESNIKALMRCINQKLGLPIDHYITITVDGTEDIIDAIGGVDINLDFQYKLVDDSVSPEEVNYVGPGTVHLDGQWCTALIRHRKSYSQGDLGRMKAQRSIYAAILKKITTELSLSAVTKIATNCMDDISTDLTLSEVLAYAEKAYSLSLEDVTIMSVPGQSQYASPTGQRLSYYSIHAEAYAGMLDEYFFPYTETVTDPNKFLDYQLHYSYSVGYEQFLQGGTLSDFDKNNEE